MTHEIGRLREISTNIKKRTSHDLIRVQAARERKAREESSVKSHEHFDKAEPSSHRQKTDEGSFRDLTRTQSHKRKAREESSSISNEPSSRRHKADEGSFRDLGRTQSHKRKARKESSVKSHEHFDKAEPSSRRHKVDEGSFHDLRRTQSHERKARENSSSISNEHFAKAEPSSRRHKADEGSFRDLRRTQSHKRKARDESSVKINEHFDKVEHSSRRQKKHFARADDTRPSLLIEAERRISEADKERWKTQNRELLKRLKEHKKNLEKFDDRESHNRGVSVDSKRKYGHTPRDEMADSLKTYLSNVCNDMALYTNEFMKYANANVKAGIRHLYKIGRGEEVEFDNLCEYQPYRDCLSYYSKLGRQACEEWGKVVIELVKRYNRIAEDPIKTSDLTLNDHSCDFFTENDVIQNLRNFDETFTVLDD